MKRSAVLSLSMLLLCSCSGANQVSAPTAASSNLDSKIQTGSPMAKRGSATVNQGFIDLVKEVNPSLAAQVDNPAGKKRLVDSLLEQELLYQESVKRGIPNQARYQNKAALYQRAIYSQALIEEEINKQAQEYYNKNKDEFTEVKLAQILIRFVPPAPTAGAAAKTPEQQKADQAKSEADALKKANEAEQKLKSGAKWEDVVNEFSDDRMGKTRGGEMGKIGKKDPRVARLEWQPLVDKAFSMKVGEVSEPIKAKDGYHIIKVVETAQEAPLSEVENRIKFKLRTQVKDELLKSISGGKETEYIDTALKEEATKAPEAPKAPGLTPPTPGAPEKPAAPGATPEVKKPEEAPKPTETAPVKH